MTSKSLDMTDHIILIPSNIDVISTQRNQEHLLIIQLSTFLSSRVKVERTLTGKSKQKRAHFFRAEEVFLLFFLNHAYCFSATYAYNDLNQWKKTTYTSDYTEKQWKLFRVISSIFWSFQIFLKCFTVYQRVMLMR